MRLFFVSILSLTANACVHQGPPVSEASFRKKVMSWEGASTRQLVDAFGYPDREMKSPEGNPVFEYSSRREVRKAGDSVSSYSPALGAVITSTSADQVANYECKVWFEHKDGKVLKVSYRGNDCKAPAEIVACRPDLPGKPNQKPSKENFNCQVWGWIMVYDDGTEL